MVTVIGSSPPEGTRKQTVANVAEKVLFLGQILLGNANMRQKFADDDFLQFVCVWCVWRMSKLDSHCSVFCPTLCANAPEREHKRAKENTYVCALKHAPSSPLLSISLCARTYLSAVHLYLSIYRLIHRHARRFQPVHA